MFNIEEFKSNALRYGLVRPNNFMAVIPAAPPCLGTSSTKFLVYLCQAASLPGSQILTTEYKRKGYAKSVKAPYDTAHGDITLTFFSDGNGSVTAFFEEWLRNIVSYGGEDVNMKGALQGELHYPEWYETNMELYVYNDAPGKGEVPIIIYKLQRAFPISIGEQAVSWDSGDQIQTIQVTFTFSDYTIQKNIAPPAGSNAGMLPNPRYFEQIQQGGSFGSRSSRLGQAESIIAGFLGFEKLSAVLGTISQVSSTIRDSLNVVNGVTANINSAINTVGGLTGRSLPNIPSIPGIRFP